MTEWISVKERLPEEGETVLTYHHPYIETAEIMWWEGSSPHWMNGSNPSFEATHWQPLPEPPNA